MARFFNRPPARFSPPPQPAPESAGQVVPLWVEPKGIDRFHASSRVDGNLAVKIRNLMFEDGVLVSRLGTDLMGGPAASTVVQIVEFVRKGQNKVTIRFCTRHIEVFNYRFLAWSSFPVPLTGTEKDFFAYTGWADKLLFSNGVDGLWEFDFTSMVVKLVPEGPSAKHLTTFGNRVVASSTRQNGGDYPVRVQWTAKNIYTRWNESTTAVPLTSDLAGGHEDLYGSPGGITDEAMGVFPFSDEQAFLVRSHSTWQMSVSGNVLAPFRFSRIFAGIGTPFRNAIVSVTSGVVFPSREEIHYISTDGHQLIGTGVVDDIFDEVESFEGSFASWDVGRQEYRIAISTFVWRWRFAEKGWTADEYPFEIKSLSRQIQGIAGIPIDFLQGIIEELPLNYPPPPTTIDSLVDNRQTDDAMMFVPESSQFTVFENDSSVDTLLTGEDTETEIKIESGVLNLDAMKAIQFLELHGEYESQMDQRLILEYSQTDGGIDGTGWLPLSLKDISETQGSEIFFVKQERVSRKFRLRLRSDATTVIEAIGRGLGKLRLLGLAAILLKVERAMASNRPKPASIEILPNPLNLRVGETQQLSIRVLGPGGQVITNVSVTLISTNSAIATVSGTGLVRAISEGSFAISATVRNIHTSVPGTVTRAATTAVASVVVTPDVAQGTVGSTQQYLATVRDASGNVLVGRTVVWASSSPAFATINTSGLATLIAPGTVAISATVEGVTGSGSLEITAAVVAVATVEVVPNGFALTVGQTTQLIARPKDSGGNVLAGKLVTWASSSTGVATVNATGLVTAVGAGSVTITATCETIPGTSAGVISAAAAVVGSVTVSPSSFSRPAGQTQALSVTVRDTAGNVLVDRVVTWSSSNSSVASTDQTGLVTAVAAGSATISATCEGKAGSCAATVTPVAVASVTISPPTFSLNAGALLTLVATPKDSSGASLPGRVITWGTSDPTKATVSSTGVVTGVAAGAVTITATCETKQGTSLGTIGTATYSPITANSGVVYSPEPNPAGALVELPRIFLDSRYNRGGVAPTFASTVTLSNTGNRSTNRTNLQNAIDAAAARSGNSKILLPTPFPCGQIILKKHAFAGSRTFVEALVMPTPEFTRCTPTSVAAWPEIQVTAGGGSAIDCAPGADGYRLQGLLFNAGPKTSVSVVYDLVRLESNGGASILGDVPTDIWLDRCLLRGGDDGSGIDNGKVRNGVIANGIRCGVVDSWIDQIGYTGFESHAIIAYNTPGPLKFVNNYCSATSISMLFGGAVPALGVPAGNPSDIEIRHHHHSRPLKWAKDSPQWDGVNARGIKNLFESKNAHRMLVEGCVFENNWADGQGGMAFVVKSSVSATADATGIGTEHLTIRHNIVRNSIRCWNFAAQPDELTATPVHAVCHFNNLAYNIGTFAGQTEGRAWMLSQSPNDLFIKHNTLVHNEFTAGLFSLEIPRTPAAQGFIFTDNLTTVGSPTYGVFMSGGAIGVAAIQAWTEDPYVWERNVLVGLGATSVGLHPAGTNQFATDVGAVGFVDAANGNYKLAPSSPYKGDAEGGSDPGCDVDKVNLATAGVITVPPVTTPCTIITSLTARPLSAFSKPGYLVPVTEPDFGTKMIRVSGDPGTTIPVVGGTWGAKESVEYSKVAVWNADMSLLRLNRRTGPPSQLFLNGTDYTPIVARSLAANEARWHPTDKDNMIVVQNDGTVRFWNPLTNGFVTKFSVSGYTNMFFGEYEGNPSYDGHWMVIDGDRISDGKKVAFVVDLLAGTKGADLDILAQGCTDLDWVSITAGGGYVVLHGIIDGLAQRSKIYDRATLTMVSGGNWNDIQQGHHDLGLDVDNTELAFVGSGSVTLAKQFYTRQLSNGVKVAPISPVTSFDWHASTRNLLRKGWGYVVTNDSTGSVLDGEMYALKFNNPAAISIERYGRHRSTHATYDRSPFMSPSPDGKRIVFGSDWGDAAGPIQAYVIDVRDICP